MKSQIQRASTCNEIEMIHVNPIQKCRFKRCAKTCGNETKNALTNVFIGNGKLASESTRQVNMLEEFNIMQIKVKVIVSSFLQPFFKLSPSLFTSSLLSETSPCE